MRSGEILGVKWSDVDFEGAKLQVKRANSYGHMFEMISGRRTVPLTPSLIQVLRSHKETQAQETQLMGCDDHDLVVAKQDGTPLRERTLYNHFYKLLKESGLPTIRFHDLRHAYARLQVEKGEGTVGHRIRGVYLCLFKESNEEVTQRLQFMLQGDIDGHL